MTSSYTITAKTFNKTSSPSPTSTVFTTRARGDTLPDFLTIAHKATKNPVEPASVDKRTVARIDRTYIDAAGNVKTVSWMLQSVVPDDCPAADNTAALADLTDFLASAITLRAANVASLNNGEVA